jgi:aminobenzoyl-glutamate transport protein
MPLMLGFHHGHRDHRLADRRGDPEMGAARADFRAALDEAGGRPRSRVASYRMGDSPRNVVTSLMPYFALIVTFAQRYDKNAGVGTVIAMMLPYKVAVSVVWIVLFLVWEVLGLPFGPR